MSCYSPRLAHRIGYNDNGKARYQICNYTDDVLDKFPPEDLKLIPCGKCIGCRLQYAKDWSNRLLMELQCHDAAWFFTATYDDEHIPLTEYNGHFYDSLNKRDIQLFIKAIRNHYPDDKIRYFICGEYGTNTLRPHYHGIIFGLHLDDVDVKAGTKLSRNKYSVLYSPKLEHIWNRGFLELGTVTPESTGYVARYCLKKVNKENKDDDPRPPEFLVMSRRPAIGRPYFDKYPDCFENDSISLPTERGGIKIYPARYFRNLIDDEERKANRYIQSKRRRRSIENLVSLPMSEYYEIQNKNKINQTQILKNRN